MWNVPSALQLNKLPSLYETKDIPLRDKIIHLHFFISGSDWFIAEFDGQDLFWGYAILNGDFQNSEWGYVSFEELKSVCVGFLEVDFDLHWQPIKASEIKNITNI